MPVIKTEFGCPDCKQSTGQSVQIIANGGSLTCGRGRSWGDTQAFLSRNPLAEFKVEMPKNLPQEGHAPLTISIPIQLKEHLQTNYGEKLSATLTGVLSQLSTNSIVISDGDLERLGMGHILGKRPANSSELVGLIYAKVCEATDAKLEKDEAVKDLKAYEGLSPGRVVIDLGDQLNAARERAKDANMPLKLWVETRFNSALKDGWF